MQEILYLEVPTSKTAEVKAWLQTAYTPSAGRCVPTPDGVRIEALGSKKEATLSIFMWGLQRSTYLKVFSSEPRPPQAEGICQELTRALRREFPPRYPDLPTVNLAQQSIFQALAPFYPKTVQYFQRMPSGEEDLHRVYRREQRWRQLAFPPTLAGPVIFPRGAAPAPKPVFQSAETAYDLIYIGGGLGLIHGTAMARLGYRVLLLEQLAVEDTHCVWHVSRSDAQQLVEVGLFEAEELEALVVQEYATSACQFFDANVPEAVRAGVLELPQNLDLALDAEGLLKRCREKLLRAGGEIQSQTELLWAELDRSGGEVYLHREDTDEQLQVRCRLLVDATGILSVIEQQLNGRQPFDSVCPMVGACISGGMPPGSWEASYADLLSSYGDVSRGRQLLWRLLPGAAGEITVYLLHYQPVHPDAPGSLLEAYEDFFATLPEYRRCSLDKLTWRKPTFGYLPGHLGSERPPRERYPRLLTLGSAIANQSPLAFSGMVSLLQQLPGLVDLVDVALKHNLLQPRHLGQIRALQARPAIVWLLSRSLIVPTWETPNPPRINELLNTLFRSLKQEDPPVAARFIAGRSSWLELTRLLLRIVSQTPQQLNWLWRLPGSENVVRWLFTYVSFTLQTLAAWLLGWLPNWVQRHRDPLERWLPEPLFWLLALGYRIARRRNQSGPTPRPPLVRGINKPDPTQQQRAPATSLSTKSDGA